MPRLKSHEDYERWKAERLKRQSRTDLESRFRKRPGLVLAIGWGFIVLAIFMILSGLSGLPSAAFMEEVVSDVPEADTGYRKFPALFKVFLFSIKHITALSLLCIFIALVVLVTGVFFLKMKSWARTVLEIFSWFALVFIVSIGILWADAWVGGHDPSASFSMFGVTMGLVIMLFYAAVPVTALVLLRYRSVRAAFGKS
ncbi:hypothetical protein EP227_03660 [bacterium]|nr:MAG: hypothetical protein EP227_03660 [bacterium]